MLKPTTNCADGFHAAASENFDFTSHPAESRIFAGDESEKITSFPQDQRDKRKIEGIRTPGDDA